MAKLFIGIAVVVMLATAALSFLAKGNIDKLQTSLKETKGRIASAEGQAKSAKTEAETAKKDAKDAQDKAADATAKADKATKDADDAKKQVSEKDLLIGEKDKKIAELEAAPKGSDPADKQKIADLTAAVADANTQKDNAVKDAAEKQMMLDSQIQKAQKNDELVSQLQKDKRDREQRLGKKGLQAHVLAVNPGWNFVVLNVGDKHGVSVDDPLLVVRGSQPVAKLRITSVEPSTSIADVLPGTVQRGISVQPGDTVIFQGRTPSTNPDSLKSPDTTAPLAPIPNTPPAPAPGGL